MQRLATSLQPASSAGRLSVITAQREALIRMTLCELLRLDSERFWQVHRSLVVQLRCVSHVERSEEGRLSLGLNALALLVAAYAFLAYALLAAALALALALGPWQFSSRLRSARPKVHRWIGRIYLGVGVLVGGVLGLLLSRYAHGGPVAQVGFAVLAVAWL